MDIALKSVAYGALASFVASGAIIATQAWHGHLSHDSHEGVQKFHEHPTPRIGGLAIAFGLLVAWICDEVNPRLIQADGLLAVILLAALPAFVAGGWEDLTKRVGVTQRLLATMGSALLAYFLTGYRIDSLDVWGLDALLSWVPISVLFTVFAVAGVANAYNIIDGFNGLSASSMLVSIIAMVVLAYQAGDVELVYFGTIFAGVILGFLVWNYPFGRIFLGDGGAYVLGFLIAWMAVMLPARHPEISPWACLMACGYPVMETLYTMLRRKLNGQKTGAPDSAHLHSLVKLELIRQKYANWRPVFRNAMVAPYLLPFAITTAVLGVLLAHHTIALVIAFFVLFIIFVLTHRRLSNNSGGGS